MTADASPPAERFFRRPEHGYRLDVVVRVDEAGREWFVTDGGTVPDAVWSQALTAFEPLPLCGCGETTLGSASSVTCDECVAGMDDLIEVTLGGGRL